MKKATIKLEELAEQMDCQSAEFGFYLDLQSGDFVPIADGLEGEASMSEKELIEANWMEDEEVVRDFHSILKTPNRYLPLPSKFDLHDYSIMERFVRNEVSRKDATALSDAMQGRGAFRRFREELERRGLLEEWYSYKTRCYMDHARQWCEENEIPYTEENPPARSDEEE